MNYIVGFVSLFFSHFICAEESLKSTPDLAIGSMIASLLLVLVCIFIFAFLMKKSNLLHNGRGKTLIKVVSTQPLTNKGRVQIIEVDEKRYLIGVTEQNITLLDTLAIPESNETEIDQDTATSSFSTLFSKISTNRNE